MRATRSDSTPRRAAHLLLGGALAVLSACRSLPPDPTIVLETVGGIESGVSTDHGIVFLGRSARGGEVHFTAFFHDGPSRELGVIEPLGGGLYTTESPIVLPHVPLTLEPPRPGEALRVLARAGRRLTEFGTRVASHPAVEGVLLELDGDLEDLGPQQIGSGVYRGEGHDRRLVGLISGRVRLATSEGEREFVTVVGPDELWRIAAYQREVGRKRRWVYREDIL